MAEIKLLGVDARGRNGWFTPASADVWRDIFGRIVIDVHSARRGDSPPLCLKLQPADALALATRLGDLAAGADRVATGIKPARDESASAARGRNGWFKPALVELERTMHGVAISISSSRSASTAPAYCQLLPSSAIALAEALRTVGNEAT